MTPKRWRDIDHFVHITGSVPGTDGPATAILVKQTVSETARALLRQKIGVVVLVGASANDATTSFDDVVIGAAADHVRDTGETGIVIRTVRHRTKWPERISDATREHLERLNGHIVGETLADDEYTGGAIRAVQARLSDGAIVIGGYRGVKDTADLLLECCPPKPVEEILVKGLTGGLPEDTRDRIDESRNRNSETDRRTVHQETDCARVAYWVAGSIADRLRPADTVSGEAQGNSPQHYDVKPTRRWPRVWYDVVLGQLATWVSSLVRIIMGFFQ